MAAVIIYRSFQNPELRRDTQGSWVEKGSQARCPQAAPVPAEEPSPVPGTRGPVTRISLNERCSLNYRRLSICYLLMRCSEHRFKLNLVQQPKETVGRKKKRKKEERPLCVCVCVCVGSVALPSGRGGSRQLSPGASAGAGWQP